MWTAVFGSTRLSISQMCQQTYGIMRSGAHQVCEKWLKDRRGSALSYDEVRQYRGILVAVTETLRLMEEIDDIIGEFLI